MTKLEAAEDEESESKAEDQSGNSSTSTSGNREEIIEYKTPN